MSRLDSRSQNPPSFENQPEDAPASSIPPLPPSAFRPPPFLSAILEEGGYLRRGLSAWPLAGLVLLTSVLMTLAYQTEVDWRFQLGRANAADYLYIQSFNPPEENEQFSFRWSSDESYLRFPGAGRLPSAELELEMQVGGRPAQLGLPRVQLWDGERLLGEYEVKPGRARYSFNYRATGRDLSGSPVFTLKTLNAFKESGHNLPLGVVVTEVRLKGGTERLNPVVPALGHFALLLAGIIIFYLGLFRAGWPALSAALWSAGLAAAVSFGLAFYRFHLTPTVEDSFMAIALAYPLLILGLRTTSAWLGRRGQAFPAKEARCLGLIFVVALTVKLAGLNHPAFIPVDHWFRIHQINRFWEYPVAFWQQYFSVSTGTTVTGQEGGSAVLGQWGVQVSLPYSPLFYLFAAPLSLIWPAHNDPNLLAAVNALASWLEVSQVFLLYILLRRAYNTVWAGRAGVIAAAIFGFYPLSFLLFSDGGYNSIFAGWLSLLFITLIVDRLPLVEKGRSLFSIWPALVLAAALLSHTSTLLLLTAFTAIYTLFLIIPKASRRAGRQFALIVIVGLGLATLLYYGWYVPELVGKTLPTLFSRLGSSNLGQDTRLLGSPLLSGFWPQLWEHFRLWPIVLVLGFTIYPQLGRGRDLRLAVVRGQKNTLSPQSSALSPAYPPTLFVAWFVTFLLFAVVDLKVNLLQKHMLFVAPLLCIGSGVVMAVGWDWTKQWSVKHRATWAQWAFGVLILGLLIFNFIQGLLVWYARIYYLNYPPGSG